jgi:hypothetical protein
MNQQMLMHRQITLQKEDQTQFFDQDLRSGVQAAGPESLNDNLASQYCSNRNIRSGDGSNEAVSVPEIQQVVSNGGHGNADEILDLFDFLDT